MSNWLTGTEKKLLAFTGLFFAVGFIAQFWAKSQVRESISSQMDSVLVQQAPKDSQILTINTEIDSLISDSASKAKSPQSLIFPISLNTATVEQLVKIKGIGPVLAGRILEYRAKIGSFTQLTQLKKVKGIGEKKLKSISAYLKIEGRGEGVPIMRSPAAHEGH